MGGGAGVIDSGFHFLDTVEYFFGPAEQVYAELRTFHNGGRGGGRAAIVDDREDTAVITITFQSGVIGTWCWSFAVPGKETRDIVFYGSEGSIEDTGYSDRFVIYHLFMGGGELRGRDGRYLSMGELQGQMRQALGAQRLERLFPRGITDHFAVELWDFLDAIEQRRQPEVNGWGGLSTLALVEAIYESAYAGRAVKIADVLAGTAGDGWQREIDEYWEQQGVPVIRRE
jgi:predicted dehydrogenase